MTTTLSLLCTKTITLLSAASFFSFPWSKLDTESLKNNLWLSEWHCPRHVQEYWLHLCNQGLCSASLFFPLFLVSCCFSVRWVSMRSFYNLIDTHLTEKRSSLLMWRREVWVNLTSTLLRGLFASLQHAAAFNVDCSSKYHLRQPLNI